MFVCFISYSQKQTNKNFYLNDSIQITLFNKAEKYFNSGKYLKTINTLNKSLEINNSNELAAKIYFKIGVSYYKLYDYKNSLRYVKTTISLLKKNNVKNELLLRSLSSLPLIGLKLETKNSFNEGFKHINEIDSLLSLTKFSWKRKYATNLNLASLYNQLKFLDTTIAYKYYKRALDIVKKEKDTLKITHTLIEMGNLYNNTNYKKSINFLNRAFILCKKTDTVNLSKLHFFYAITYIRFNKFEKSYQSYEKGFNYLVKKNYNTLSISEKKKLINSKNKRTFLYMLPLLAETYLKEYHKGNKDIILIRKSIQNFKLADHALDLILDDNKEFKSKLFWKELSNEFYGKAIRACYLNNNIEDALYFMEKNKALLLMEDMAKENYRRTVDIPIKLLAKENKFKEKITLLNNALTLENLKSKKDALNKTLLDTNRELLTLQDSIYKSEKKTTKQPKLTNIIEIQKNIKINEVFIEYHVTVDHGLGIFTNTENGYVIVITKDKKFFLEINNLSLLKDEVSKLIKKLKVPFKTSEDFLTFNKLSNSIYTKLFPTVEIRNLIKNKKVKIAPDSYLSLLPFETLITKYKKNNDLNKPNYLIKECTLSYLYSYSFLRNTNIVKPINNKFLGFAPTTFTYDNLIEINNSKNEVLNLKKYFQGETYINQSATKSNFVKNIENYNIIHLATHANAQDSINPWIAFKNKKISLDELYLVKNNASLVVLSGCNTTLGKQEIGESVISLARGFFYGGSQSVVSSLWNVDDTATPYIMNQFYKNLSNGNTKSEALHLAKLNYLENHSLSEASPHFWASFILLGQDNVIITKPNYLLWFISSFIIIMVILIFRFRKNNSKT